MAFFQEPPRPGDAFATDRVLRSWLSRVLPAEVRAAVTPDLARMGALATGHLLALQEADRQSEPRLIGWDPWGRRIDRIELTPLWREAQRIAAETGLVALPYERAHGAFSRLHQFALVYLFHPSSDVYTCPLAMSDGAAKTLLVHGNRALIDRALPRLTSRDPARAWTSGQWMTERTGGSDVSGTSTIAEPDADGNFRLHGTKWFTSATTSEMALALARIGSSEALSLFQLELRDASGRLNDIEVHRLKDKLGTRALPTAELSLRGTPARLVGEPGKGIRTIATMLNITRLYNACCAAAQMRRAVMLAEDYARRRIAFGRPLIEQPLHAETLRAMEQETRVATLMIFHAAALLGRDETGKASEDERKLLRLMTPLVKLYTAKQAVAVCSEALEAFGGAGYIEDTGLPVLLRNAQVLAIWEGTTNVLALDLLRALGKDDSLPLFAAFVRERVTGKGKVDEALSQELENLPGLLADAPERNARRLAFAMARILGTALLAHHGHSALQWLHGNRQLAG